MNLMKIAAKIRRTAYECGGNHHTPEETEAILLTIADELDDIAINTADVLAQATNTAVLKYMGISQDNYERWLRHINLERIITEKTDGAEGEPVPQWRGCMDGVQPYQTEKN